MSKYGIIQLNPFHFLTAIVLFGIVTYAIGSRNIKGTLSDERYDYLTELNNENFLDSISAGECFVLFYIENSNLCREMSCNLNQLAGSKQANMRFFKLNVDRYPETVEGYNISGVPNIFIFKNGKEHKRIMGLVPIHNLEIIYKKVR